MKLSVLFILSLIVLGCKSQLNSSSSSCHLSDSYAVDYLGHAFGKGRIEFSPSTEDPNAFAYIVSVFSPGSDTPNIAIKGVAQCQAGIVTGNFGAGTSSKPELSVLGGRFEGIFNHPAIEKPFGRWEIALYDAKKNKNYNLSGYWKNKTESSLTQL